MEKNGEQKNDKKLLILVIILIVMVISLCGYIAYDKLHKEQKIYNETDTKENEDEKPKAKINYDSYREIGYSVTIGEEEFDILNDTDDKIILLASYNLYIPNGDEVKQQTETMGSIFDDFNMELDSEDSKSDIPYYLNEKGDILETYKEREISGFGKVKNYVYDKNAEIYDTIEKYVKYIKDITGFKNVEGRLLSEEEINYIQSVDSNMLNPNGIGSYWLGTAQILNDLDSEYDETNTAGIIKYYDTFEEKIKTDYFFNSPYGVRPVIIFDNKEFPAGVKRN